LSKKARAMLDEAGFPDVAIVASDSIDEYRLQKMKEMGAEVSIWGIGTRLVTAYDQPALGGVYKLSGLQNESGQWEDRIKLSEESIKISNPGRQQVRRYYDTKGLPLGDMIYDPHGPPSDEMFTYPGEGTISLAGAQGEDLLVPVFRSGQLVYQIPSLTETRDWSLRQQELFQDVDAATYPLGLEKGLHARKQHLIEKSMVDA
jgi:nicotinate phosphoribosyltransferase